MKKNAVVITPETLVDVPGTHVRALNEAGFEVRYPEDKTFGRGLCDDEETVRVVADAVAVIAGNDHYSNDVLNRLPKLRVIARAGVGYDRVDVKAATDHNVVVTITPNANHEGVAEHALALIFAVAKSIVRDDKATRNGVWRTELTQPVRGKTLGILGLGRIGRSTASRAAALGMTVIATETQPDKPFLRQHNIELVDFDTLLARSDFLSLHCPLNSKTQGMFNRQVFDRMKPGSVLINTARGKLVVESDLVEAITSGHLSGAGLDVFQQEPPDTRQPLFQLDNVILTPHMAGIDKLSTENSAIEAAECIIKLHRGQWPTGSVVNDTLRSEWKW